MDKVKRFLKTLLVFFTGNVLSKLVSLFLLPLYTGKLSPEQYGSFDIVQTIINLIAPIAFLQIWDGMFRYAFDYTERKDKFAVISNAMVVSFGGIAVYLALFFAISRVFVFEYVVYAMVYGLFYALQYIYTFAARVFLKNKLFVISGIVNTLVSACLNIFFILYLHWDVKSLYIAQAIGLIIQIIIVEIDLKLFKNFSFKAIDKDLIKKMIKFSLPLCLATISYWLLSGFTKMVVFYKLGADANGLYAVANRFASAITIVVTIFQYAWNETAYLMANDSDRTKSYSLCVDLMLKGVAFGTALLILFIKFIFPFFVDAQYQQALSIVPATIVGVAMNSLAGLFGTLFMTEKKTGAIMTTTLISAAINIVLSFVLSIKFGLQGAVVGLAIAFTILMLIRLIMLMRKFSIRLELSNLLLLLVFVICIPAFYLLNNIWCAIIFVLLIAGFVLSLKKYIVMFLKSRRTSQSNETIDKEA